MRNCILTLSWILLLLTSCAEKTGNGKQDKGENEIGFEETSIPHSKIIIRELTDSLQPKSIDLSLLPKPSIVLVPKTSGAGSGPPVTQWLPVLQNEKGAQILDKDGNPFILGDGGKSFFGNFNSDDGLALDGVYSSFMDKDGALWFGTLGGGVSRYDGNSFTNFTVAHGLANNSVMGIVEDEAGNIWFATAGGGVSKFNGKTFINFTKADGLASNEVWSIARDKKGRLWFGTIDGGVSCFNGKSFVNYDTAQGLAHNGVLGIKEDSRGNLWFATLGGGVSCYDGKSFTNFNSEQGLSANTVFGIAEDKSGNLWFATRRGASRYDGNLFTNFSTSEGLAHNAVMCIKADRYGEIWFGTNGGGVSRYDGKSFCNYTSSQGLSNNNVFTIEEDKSGNFWFGTNGGGVSRFSDNSFTSFTTAEGLTNNKVTCIAEDKNGQLWFGTNGGGASRFDKKSFTNFTIEQGLPNNSITSLIEDRNGKIWFGTNGGGVSCYDGKSFTTFTVAQGLANNTVQCNREDRAGNLWFGTYGGASRFDGKSFTNFGTAQGLAGNIINSIEEDNQGNIWFGTNGGLSRYDGNSISSFATLQGLGNGKINCIAKDTSGNLWFGSLGGGVSRYDGKSFANFTTNEGLAENSVYDIIQDNQGNIIIATNLGFTLIPAKAISRPFSEIKPDLEYFNNPNGYPVKDANGPNAIYCDSEGMIWAGTGSEKTALVRFNYNALRKDNRTPNLHIRAIKISEENISWSNLASNKARTDSNQKTSNIIEELTMMGKELTEAERETLRRRFGKIRFDSITPFYPKPVNLVLPYRHNNVSFEFNAIETGRPQFVNYQYMLEGYDKDWSPILRKTSASFGNITEGHYTFKVKAQLPNGAWSEPLSYSFKVLPPLHRTWLAYTIYLVISVFLLWRLNLVQKARTIRKEREKAGERELMHASEIEKAYEELQATQSQLIHSEKMASLGVLTAGIAHEIQNPLNFVNNFSEINIELLNELKEGPLRKLESSDKKEANDIIDSLAQNLDKISVHGKRADSIVKGMLQHSRSGKAEKEPIEINKLTDEYVRLAYHGLRAKDKAFNATIKTDFEKDLGPITVIPQDIGRAILNLINNAFYAVYEKGKLQAANYEPTVTVTTRRLNNLPKTAGAWVEISIADNGKGIPQSVMDKIFQPFFTTKPAGQGTGLGLSLSYDIVKAHGGKLKVITEEGSGSEFIIQLPVG